MIIITKAKKKKKQVTEIVPAWSQNWLFPATWRGANILVSTFWASSEFSLPEFSFGAPAHHLWWLQLLVTWQTLFTDTGGKVDIASGSKESACNAGDPGLIPWRKAWQPTPLFLSGAFHGQRCLVGYSPWGCQESDTFSFHFSIHISNHSNMHLSILCTDSR